MENPPKRGRRQATKKGRPTFYLYDRVLAVVDVDGLPWVRLCNDDILFPVEILDNPPAARESCQRADF